MPVVVWEWMTDRGLWNPYPPDVSNYIEDKYKIFEDRKPFPGTLSQVDLQHANKDYNRFVIDFGYFSSRNKITGSNRPIRREFCDENSPAAKGILWQWQGDDFAEWVCYSFDVAACLENAANSNYSMIDLDRPPFHLPYIIRLSSMEQVRNGSGFTRKIRRLDTPTPYAKSSSSSHLNGSAAVTSVMVSGFQNSSYTSSYVSPVHHVALSQPAIWNTPAFPNSSFHPSTSQGFAVVSRATAGTNSAQPTSASPLAWPTQYAHGVAAAASSANVGYPGGTCQNMPSQLSSTGAFTIGSAPPTNTQPKRVRKLKQSQPTTLPSTSYSQGQNSISPMDQQTAQTLTTSNQTSQFSFPLSPFGFSQQQVSAVAIVQQPQPSAMSVANQSSWMSWRNPTSATQSSVSSGSATMWSQLRQGSGYITSAVAKLSGGIVDNLVSGLEAIGKRKRKSGAGSSNQTSSQQQQQQPFAHASFNVNAPLPLPPFAVSPQPPPMYNTPVNSAANCNGAAPAFGFVSPPHPSSISLSSLSVPTSAASVTPRCSSRRLGQQPDKADGPTWNAKRARGDFGRIQRVDQLPESSDATARVILQTCASVVRSPPADEDCCICCDSLTNPSGFGGQEASVVIELSKCRHKYHLECVCSMYDNGPKSGSLQCPTCKYIYGEKRGDCPDGEMTYSYRRESLAGYPGCGSIVITYNIRNGMKNNKWFKARGFPRYGYLPDNEKGNWVLELLKVAWQRRLTFTIGTSVTTGEHDVVVWNEIHHKTSPTNEHGHGYPDSNYLDNVIKELAAQGVTERDSDDRDMSCDS